MLRKQKLGPRKAAENYVYCPGDSGKTIVTEIRMKVNDC